MGHSPTQWLSRRAFLARAAMGTVAVTAAGNVARWGLPGAMSAEVTGATRS